MSVADAQTIIDAATKPAQAAGIQVETGGQLGQKVSKPATESSELIGIIAAMVILTFTFGTVVAMLLPIIDAIVGLAAHALDHPDPQPRRPRSPTVAPTLATMIGLGVGIDYALFIVTRHFRGLDDGLELRESIARAAATSGGAVFFAGCTVTIALVSLAVANIPLVTTMGFMAAIAVVIAVLAAVTLLPAMLAIIGPHINSLRVRRPPTDAQAKKGVWAKWARRCRRPSSDRRSAGAGDPDSARDPAAVAEPWPEGHRRAVDLDHRAPGLRPDLGELRARRERAADRRARSGRPPAARATRV